MSEHNLNRWERLFSLAIGVAGLRNGFRRGGVDGWLEVGASALMIRRGLSGHCRVKAALLQAQANRPARLAQVEAEGLQRRLDDALEETFPASDPISP